MRANIRRVCLVLCLLLGLGAVPQVAVAAPGPWVTEAAGWRYRTVDNGTEYSSPRGAFTVKSPFFDAKHRAFGGGRGLGYPLENEVLAGGGAYYQRFERGVIYVVQGAATVVRTGGDAVGAVHTSAGGGTGTLGYPLADAVTEATSYRYQRFQRGTVYASPAGGYAVMTSARDGDVSDYHRARGGGRGDLGYPVGPFIREGVGHGYQRFERAIAYERIAGSAATTAAVQGGFIGAHAGAGGGRGAIGYPIAEEFLVQTSPREWMQHFERGSVYFNAYGPTVCVIGQACAG